MDEPRDNGYVVLYNPPQQLKKDHILQFVAQIGIWGVALQNVPQTQINNIVFVVALQKIRLTC